MDTFVDCQQRAGEIIATRLGNNSFRCRLERASSSWGMEHEEFLRQVQTIIAIALFGPRRAEGVPASSRSTQEALEVLRDGNVVEIFGTLPAGLGNTVKHLRLLSMGLTAHSAIQWERLSQTARQVLDNDTVFLDPAQSAGETSQSMTTGTITTGKAADE